MNGSTLLAGLLLPWIIGYLWLNWAEARFSPSTAGSFARRAGYGFFLGYALLYFLIEINALVADQVSYAGVMAVLALFGLAGGFLLYRTRSRDDSARAGSVAEFNAYGPWKKALLGVLAAWTAAHLLFAAIEILVTPVYPWDAWLVWIYRAKAWFFAGSVVDLASAGEWLAATDPAIYTVHAHNYPQLASVVPFWAAVSLGQWSETLVNVPTLFCAIAIGLALFGQCRAAGLDLLWSAAFCFALFSIPLMGAHMALGGYADIWMAGFAGLGFMAMIRGLAERNRFHLGLGLAMVALGMLVKNEGVVWFYAALIWLALAVPRPRASLAGLGVAGILMLAVALAGGGAVELPVLGTLGYSEGRLFIPFIGSFAVQLHDVRSAYLANLFMLGSWHLAWLLVIASVVFTLRRPFTQAGKAVLLFLLTFAATQAFIFGFTDQGAWASQYTAINRLPLQFLPALLFASAIILHERHQQLRAGVPVTTGRVLLPGKMRRWLAPAVAAAVVAAWALIYLAPGASAREPATLEFGPDRFSFVMGRGAAGESQMVVEQYQNGFALVSSGAVSLQADDFRIMRLQITADFSDPATAPALFWRTSNRPESPYRLILDGAPVLDLAEVEDWTGEVTEFGFLFMDAGSAPAVLGPMMLEAHSLGAALELARRDWLQFEPWSQRSINFIDGGAARQSLSLTLLVVFWLLASITLHRLSGRQGTTFGFALGVLLLAWMLLDARWTLNGARQADQSLSSGWSLTETERLASGADGELYRTLERFRQRHFGDGLSRILVVGDREQHDYYLQRAKYHLLPDSAQVAREVPGRLDKKNVDYVLFIGEYAGQGLTWAETLARLPMNEAWRDSLQLADTGEMSLLFSVDRN